MGATNTSQSSAGKLGETISGDFSVKQIHEAMKMLGDVNFHTWPGKMKTIKIESGGQVSPSKSYCTGPKGQKMESVGAGVWKDVKTGKQYSKKLTGWVPFQTQRERRAARRRKNARYFKGHVTGGYVHHKFVTSPKTHWMKAQIGTPSGYVNLMVKHNAGKDIYTVTRTSVKDFKTETVVSGDLDSKVKVKKSKGAKSQIHDMQDAIWKVLALYDAFEAKAWTGPVGKDGVPTENKKYKEIDPHLLAVGYFKKGVPIHCECGKHTAHDDNGREISCKDFADAINAMRGLISL